MKTRSCSVDPTIFPTVLGRWLLLSCWLAVAGLPAHAAQFEDVTTTAGITGVTGFCVTGAWGDYDNDGQIDLYVAVGFDGVASNALFRNDGDGTFTQQHAEAGPIGTDRHDSLGCAWIDFNNDGYRDMLVINGGFSTSRNDLYLNAGNGTFYHHNAGPLTDLPLHESWRTWSACADYDGDGFVDVYLAEAVNISGPVNFLLYRGSASATFQADPRNNLPSLAMANSAVWGDFDNDGDPDLFTCNYTSPSILWRNDGLCQFTQVVDGPPSSGTTFGAAWADFDNDGDLDIVLCGFSDMNSTALFRNNGIDGFSAVTNLAGLGPGWTDYDNDGHADLLLASTHQGLQVRPGLYHNNGDGTFTAVSDVFVTDYCSNPAWGDYDNDGFMDVVICHQQGVNRLYRNLGNSNHWLKFQLVGTASNRDAIGAKIRLQATIGGQSFWQMQEVNYGSMLQNDARLNFGLGDATNVNLIRIEWPSGNVQELENVAADQLLSITEPAGILPVRPTAGLGDSITLQSRISRNIQWYHEGVALEGETNRNLTFTNVSLADAGRYWVVVHTTTGDLTNFTYLAVDSRFEKISQGDVVSDRFRSIQGAWGDYDADGDLDLAVVGGYWDTSGATNSALYRNDGTGNLVRVANTPLATNQDRNCYLGWADYDNDGDLDLAVAIHESTPMALYLNQGDDHFIKQRTTADWILNGLDARGATTAWGDYDSDGRVDLMVINWVAGGGPPGPNSLLHNAGNGRFEVDTTSALALENTSEETIAWIDFDQDGDLDFSSVESGSSTLIRRLFRNLGHGQFEPITDSPFWGDRRSIHWGHVWADLDSDNDFDVLACVGGTDAAYDAIFLNDRHGNLTRANLAAMNLPDDIGSIPAVGDFDNDGYLDLFCAGADGKRNRLFHNQGDGTFEEILTGGIPTYSGYSYQAAWGDYDGDGYLDLFVANDSIKGNLLYRNNHRDYLAELGQTNHWLRINLRGTQSNRNGIGAKVRVTAIIGSHRITQLRQIGGQTCAPELFAHFGLGNAAAATLVTVEWPSGTQCSLRNVSADQALTILEPCIRCTQTDSGQIELTAFADLDRPSKVEVSTDLVSWSVLAEFTGQGETPVTVTDPQAPATSQRFYRLK